jgi:DNA-binding sugar fermentation-stimulating protein
MISQLAKSVLESLRAALPNTLIKDEVHVHYKGTNLFFDFHLPTLNLYVEVQGIQHTEFNKHFHNDAAAFRGQKKRDALKKEWCELNDKTLLCVNYDEIPISPEGLLVKIEEAQNDGRSS